MKRFLVVVLVMILSLSSCLDLEVENLNEPTSRDVIHGLDDVFHLSEDLFAQYFSQVNEYVGLGIMMEAMADAETNCWCRTLDVSREPRYFTWPADWHSCVSFMHEGFWEYMYSTLSICNDCNSFLENNSMQSDPSGMGQEALQAWVYFIHGSTQGFLGLVFDKGLVIDGNDYLSNLKVKTYKKMVDAGISKLDQAIDECKSNTFSLPGHFISGYAITNLELEQFARTIKAKIMIQWPRNGKEAEEIDWQAVLNTLTGGAGGIDFDLAPECDGNRFVDLYKVYNTYPGWGRIDHRIINLMDVDYPSRWPDESRWQDIGLEGDPGEAISEDSRLITDFEYLATQDFRPDRGHYHFSHYAFSRYDYLYENAWYGLGPTPFILAWEVSMIEAEARLMTGDKSGAIAILNDPAGARKMRGGLPDIDAGASEEELAAAIHYEMEVECYRTNAGYSFFGMRRRDMLQYGTLNHWPIPTSEQELLGIPLYTIDGPPDGINRALYGWVGLDGQVVPVGGWPGYPDKGK